MKKIFIILLLIVTNLFAIKIGSQDIRIGDNILSLNEDVFEVYIDSLGYAKLVATNKVPISMDNDFHHAIIEATILNGTIYNITLINNTKIGCTIGGQEIDSMKSFFNNYTKKLNKQYGDFNYSNDNRLPYFDFRDIQINTLICYNKNITKVALAIIEDILKEEISVRLIYFNGDYEENLKSESMYYNVNKMIINIQSLMSKDTI
jgi:hypothetical protein